MFCGAAKLLATVPGGGLTASTSSAAHNAQLLVVATVTLTSVEAAPLRSIVETPPLSALLTHLQVSSTPDDMCRKLTVDRLLGHESGPRYRPAGKQTPYTPASSGLVSGRLIAVEFRSRPAPASVRANHRQCSANMLANGGIICTG